MCVSEKVVLRPLVRGWGGAVVHHYGNHSSLAHSVCDILTHLDICVGLGYQFLFPWHGAEGTVTRELVPRHGAEGTVTRELVPGPPTAWGGEDSYKRACPRSSHGMGEGTVTREHVPGLPMARQGSHVYPHAMSPVLCNHWSNHGN